MLPFRYIYISNFRLLRIHIYPLFNTENIEYCESLNIPYELLDILYELFNRSYESLKV
jgi:hypothetical protein